MIFYIMHKLHNVIYAVIAYNIIEVITLYKKMYLLLFNAITTVLNENNIDKIRHILKKAQIDAEELCIESEEEI